MMDMGIVMGGVYRENVMDAGIYNYIENTEQMEMLKTVYTVIIFV